MIDPMLSRLAGSLVFASLFAGLMVVAVEPDRRAGRDDVKVAELQKAVERIVFTRP